MLPHSQGTLQNRRSLHRLLPPEQNTRPTRAAGYTLRIRARPRATLALGRTHPMIGRALLTLPARVAVLALLAIPVSIPGSSIDLRGARTLVRVGVADGYLYLLKSDMPRS